ncbi:MAG: MBL fold metallo-hydrolase [Candidatus Micrarchaeota archaeon]|nr:MBL fold metallo-hydrolase [Candidatus Micrarchaeota archaeon]
MRFYCFGSGGAEGIPVPYCACRTCSYARVHKVDLLRPGYAVEMGESIFWLELSPDLRKQLLTYGKEPQYFFVSHIHYDHIVGFGELKMFLKVALREGETRKTLTLLMPKHLYNNFFRPIKTFFHMIPESFYHSFFELVDEGYIRLHIMEKDTFYSINGARVMQVENVHSGGISSSLIIDKDEKRFVYLADAEKVDDGIYDLLENKPADLLIAHTPILDNFTHQGHMGLEDLLELNAKKILVTHFSHKVDLTPEEIREKVKAFAEKWGKDMEPIFDGEVKDF